MLAPGSRLNSVSEVPVSGTGNTVQFQLNLDGQSVTNNMAVGFGQPRYSRDAIAEFEFISNRFDASQGRSIGVQVNAVTKSGTNTPTGSFSGYFRSDKFNAADPVAGEVIPYSDQQLSVTYGGPILRDRFHYFGSFEYEREPQTYIYNTPYPYFNGTLTGTRTEKKGYRAARLSVLAPDAAVGTRVALSEHAAVRSALYRRRHAYDGVRHRYTSTQRTAADDIHPGHRQPGDEHRKSRSRLVPLEPICPCQERRQFAWPDRGPGCSGHHAARFVARAESPVDAAGYR